MATYGESDRNSAGEWPARETRLGRRTFLMGEYSDFPASRSQAATDFSSEAFAKEEAQGAAMPLTTRGSADSHGRVNMQTSEGTKSLINVKHLSTSR